MSGEPGVRRILPQSTQMQNFTFAPNNLGPRENQKNYVFVDEHNRHKRLKVMRACEGCRRRKIKCDAATTNTWPCSACIRLKLHCVPPTVTYDRDFAAGQDGFVQERVGLEGSAGDDEYRQQVSMQQQVPSGSQKNLAPVYSLQVPYAADHVGVYQPVSYAEQTATTQAGLNYQLQTPVSALDHQYSPQNMFPTPPSQSHHAESPRSYDGDYEQSLVELLGDLKMDLAGSAPYLNNKSKNKSLVEEPPLEDIDDFKVILPPTLPGPDLKIRIPPELMPDEATAMQYFDMYFNNVHPYVPVLNKTAFYQQWHTNRDTISPLILEAIFAIGGRLADEPAQGHQWLALASKHADSFMDVPRLSTLQGLLIVLKARESAPKRGYYFRSWMTVVQCVQMGKDLGLDEHCEDHKAGRHCGSSYADCLTKTRIWQTIFDCELMIGSPQGRTDLSVDMDSIDLSLPRPGPGLEESELIVSRNFTYFTRMVIVVRKMNLAYSRIRKKKDWGLDPELVQLNPSFDIWITELPADLQIAFPADGSVPWLPSHFIGNLHSYYYLSIIMLHRPQLMFMEPTGVDGRWKHHMMLCYSSAKALCRIQEAILQQFGLSGLLCMQRGINFTIYCVLTCTVLHLVAITSPDPDLNSDAREYFTRHMRILEKCSNSWPMPDMQQAIDSLRQAFSADIRKPFVLKSTFPYGSPGPASLSPPRTHAQYRGNGATLDQQSLEQPHAQQQSQVSYPSHPISPPISTGDVDTKSDSPAVQSLVMMASGQRAPQPPMTSGVPVVETSTWNPTRIFDQWNTTFGTPNPSHDGLTPSQTSLKLPIPGAQEIPTLLDSSPTQSHTSQPMPPQQYSAAPLQTFASPSMWQESVASVYEGGLKRHWDYDEHPMVNPMARRLR
ncbi:hypothetical protein F5884DRAFT_671551 [Xylogone sp. PMI_703]|nr:hypothetical protein F5884DRAFT_671551 [Xylogone sp. PMI_703]